MNLRRLMWHSLKAVTVARMAGWACVAVFAVAMAIPVKAVEQAGIGDLPALNVDQPDDNHSTSRSALRGPPGEPGARGPRGADGVAGVVFITASETITLPRGASRTLQAHCPSGSLVSGCSVYSSHPYGIPYRFYPVDEDSCEVTFLNIGGQETTFEFQAIAHCIVTHAAGQ